MVKQGKQSVNEKKWYVLRVKASQENKVKKLIESRFHDCSDIGKVIVPMQKVYYIRKDKKILKEKAYYPGYVMMEVALNPELINDIKNINEVVSFLTEAKGSQPLPMRDSEVNKILNKMDELTVSDDRVVNIPFIVGEKIKVVDGPFNGFIGVIDRINEEKRRLEVMVKIFGRKTPLELSYTQVERNS